MFCVKPIFWKLKMLVCTLGGEGGRGSEKVYCLYTHENVDILDGTLFDTLKWDLNKILLTYLHYVKSFNVWIHSTMHHVHDQGVCCFTSDLLRHPLTFQISHCLLNIMHGHFFMVQIMLMWLMLERPLLLYLYMSMTKWTIAWWSTVFTKNGWL